LFSCFLSPVFALELPPPTSVVFEKQTNNKTRHKYIFLVEQQSSRKKKKKITVRCRTKAKKVEVESLLRVCGFYPLFAWFLCLRQKKDKKTSERKEEQVVLPCSPFSDLFLSLGELIIAFFFFLLFAVVHHIFLKRRRG
jgi:hypothetical protein